MSRLIAFFLALLAATSPLPEAADATPSVPGGSAQAGDRRADAASPAEMLDAALAYAAAGTPVFPLGDGGTPKAKTPRTPHGFKDATSDAAAIRAWWQRWPKANLGIPTGKASGFFVVDLDPDGAKHGIETFRELEEKNGAVGETPLALTPRGGRHIYLAWGDDIKLTVNAKVLPGIDYRGEGGFIVAPPSIGANGKPYAWHEGLSPWDVAPAPTPRWVVAALSPSKSRGKHEPANPSTVAGRVPEGKRHSEAARLAGALTRQGFGEDAILAALRAQPREGDYPDEDLRRIAKDAATKWAPGTAPAEGSVIVSDSDWFEPRKDAWYRVRREHTRESERVSDVPVIAQPFEAVRIVRTEREERFVVRTTEEISGTFEEGLKKLASEGRFLKPGMASEVLAHFRLDLAKRGLVETGRETFEAFVTPDGKLALPERCYPRPGPHAEEYERVHAILDHKPSEDEWKCYLDFQERLLAKEWAPSKAAAAMAPLARVLRERKFTVPAIYHLSTNSGVGKTTTAMAYTVKAWNGELFAAEELNSDFRFAFYLSGPGTPALFDEAEKFDWHRYGAAIKKSLESDRVTSRGTKELGMQTFPSRRALIFTGNALPPLLKPTLVRLFVVRFNEERAKSSHDEVRRFDLAWEKLTPIGPALARAAVARWRTAGALLAEIAKASEEIDAEHGPFKDHRRARTWAIALLGLRVWEDASGGIHKAPSVADFVTGVVRPVEEDTFASQLSRLERFRSWFAAWRARNTYKTHDGAAARIVGEDETWKPHVFHAPSGAVHAGILATSALVGEHDKEQRDPTGALSSLGELARLVIEDYPIRKDDLLDGEGKPKLHDIGGKRQRAVFVPDADPDVFHVREADARERFGGSDHGF